MIAYFAIAQGMIAIYNAIMQIDIAQLVLDLVIMEFPLDENRMLASFSQSWYFLLMILMMNGRIFTLVSRAMS